MFDISEAFCLSNPARAAHKNGYPSFAYAILCDAFTRIKTKVDNIFNGLLFEEDCVNLCTVIVPPILHVFLKLASMNFDLFDLRCCEVSPDAGEVACPYDVTKCHE